VYGILWAGASAAREDSIKSASIIVNPTRSNAATGVGLRSVETLAPWAASTSTLVPGRIGGEPVSSGTEAESPHPPDLLNQPMTDEARGYLVRQYEMAWMLASYHLDGLTTAECLWRPARAGLHVHQRPDGSWRADWPEHEGYDLGPPSIAWITWHMGFWWSTVLDHWRGDGTLAREDVAWPGDADGVREWLGHRRPDAL
jgi:hypothetical protein